MSDQKQFNSRQVAQGMLLVAFAFFLAGCEQPAEESQAPSILIHNGVVVTSEGRENVDIRIVGETIAEMGQLTRRPSDIRAIDAGDLLVLPGGIDAHTHLRAAEGFDVVDDYESGTRAALAGGITTVGHMGVDLSGTVLPSQLIEHEAALINAEALADMFIHFTVFDPSDAVVQDLPALVAAGQPSIKIFMPHQVGAPFPNPYDENLADFEKVVEAAARQGLRVAIHAEDADTIRTAVARLTDAGNTTLASYAESRPVKAEATAVERAIEMAARTGASIYLVHISSADAIDVIEQAAQEASAEVFVETRPIYLHLDESRYAAPDGPLYVSAPPLRTLEDQDAVWRAMANGSIDTIASDHLGWTPEQKMNPEQTITSFLAGSNNMQVMLPMLFSEGVNGGRLSLERFVELTATNPAKIFGMYPTKGTLAVGSHADIVLWRADEVRTIRNADILSNSGFSIHEGAEVKGWPVLTLRRGEVVYEDGRVVAEKGSGRLVARKPVGG
jgi:dihydropyrimidinase